MKCHKCGQEVDQGVQGVEDQYVTTCCLASHLGKPCVLFGVKVDDQGKKWAIIGFTQEVPIEEVVTWSRKLAPKEDQ